MRVEAFLNRPRCLRLIRNALAGFKVDLRGLRVLTEAGSNYFVLTPLIAALGGAEEVFVLTRDSVHGAASAIIESLFQLAGEWGAAGRLTVLEGRADARLARADVVTNLGFVRPIDEALIRSLRPTAAVPLMCETWEFRPPDLDLAYCWKSGVPVLGTDESFPLLRTMDYIGICAAKALFMAGVEIMSSKLVVLGSGKFGESCRRTLSAMGAEARTVEVREGRGFEADLIAAAAGADAILVAEHHSRTELIGAAGGVAPERFAEKSAGLTIVHVCGNVDASSFRRLGINAYPDAFAPPGWMSLTTDFAGPRPLIDLHTAGIAVGASLARLRLEGASAREAEERTLAELPFAQGFSEDLRGRYAFC